MRSTLLAWTVAGSLLLGGVASPVFSGGKVADAKAIEVSDPVVTYNTKSCVYFGNYYQRDTNQDGVADEKDTREPIKWQILSQTEDDLFLMADSCLVQRRYHESDGDITWENCDLREWLNKDFLETAFTEEEQQAIVTTHLVNDEREPDSPWYESFVEENIYNGGNETDDKIYLLSANELENRDYDIYLEHGIEAPVTDYAGTKHGTYAGTSETTEGWWLRSSGKEASKAALVYDRAEESLQGDYANKLAYVRPVLHLNRKADVFRDAGEVKLWLEKTSWDTIAMGEYYQEDTSKDGVVDESDEKQPLTWRVLSVEGDTAYVMADQAIAFKKYHDYSQALKKGWETATLRTWLNGDFYNQAFSEEEKQAIISYETPQREGTDMSETENRICLPMYEDITNEAYGFSGNDNQFFQTLTRQCQATQYAKQELTFNGDETGYNYWLLNLVNNNANALVILSDGEVERTNIGMKTDTPYVAVRPVMYVDLSSDCWKKVGTTEADDSAVYYARLKEYDEQKDWWKKSDTDEPGGDEKQKEPVQQAASNTETGTNSVTANTTQTTESSGNTEKSKTDSTAVQMKRVSIRSVRNKKSKKMVVVFKAINHASGYQIQYALNKKFTRGSKMKTVKKTKCTIGKLKKKTYYIRVRAYAKTEGAKTYGSWSAVKKIKIKK